MAKKSARPKAPTHLKPDGTTTCCGACTTYCDGTECCKACYEAVTGYIGAAVEQHPVRIRLPRLPAVAWSARAGLRTANVETEDGNLRVHFFTSYDCAGTVKVDGAHEIDIPRHARRIVEAALALFDASRPTRCGFGPLAAIFVDGVNLEEVRRG